MKGPPWKEHIWNVHIEISPSPVDQLSLQGLLPLARVTLKDAVSPSLRCCDSSVCPFPVLPQAVMQLGPRFEVRMGLLGGNWLHLQTMCLFHAAYSLI